MTDEEMKEDVAFVISECRKLATREDLTEDERAACLEVIPLVEECRDIYFGELRASIGRIAGLIGRALKLVQRLPKGFGRTVRGKVSGLLSPGTMKGKTEKICVQCASPIDSSRTNEFCSEECETQHDRQSYEEG